MCKQNTGFVSKTPGELLLRTKGYKKVWLLGKYKEMRGKSRLLHSTVQKQKPSSPFEANETKSNHLLRVVQHCSTVGSESAEQNTNKGGSELLIRRKSFTFKNTAGLNFHQFTEHC